MMIFNKALLFEHFVSKNQYNPTLKFINCKSFKVLFKYSYFKIKITNLKQYYKSISEII